MFFIFIFILPSLNNNLNMIEAKNKFFGFGLQRLGLQPKCDNRHKERKTRVQIQIHLKQKIQIQICSFKCVSVDGMYV